MRTAALAALAFCFITELIATNAVAQGVQPYSNAITDRVVRLETPMAAPPVNVVFSDPDFGSAMVRVTDETTPQPYPGGYFRNPAVGEKNAWSADDRKFYVVSQGGHVLVFRFEPSTMQITSPPLRVGLRFSATFSYSDPDLIYGTTNINRFTISEYRFSTNKITPVLDTTTCGMQPPLDVNNPSIRSNDDLGLSGDEIRMAMSEGGSSSGKENFIVVYDRTRGCRWYNTQTGQIGGQWGPPGYTNAKGFLIGHARISGDGKYIKIHDPGFGARYWQIDTLNVTSCPLFTNLSCGGYQAIGHSSNINAAGRIDEMNILKRPLSNLADITQLVWPLPVPPAWGQTTHLAWINAYLNDNNPVCGTLYNYDGDTEITRAWDDEIVCMETDGLASTVWRFAHHRAYWHAPYFNTQPLGNISLDGRFFLFTSTWDGQLGSEPNGIPRSDMWIVKLD